MKLSGKFQSHVMSPTTGSGGIKPVTILGQSCVVISQRDTVLRYPLRPLSPASSPILWLMSDVGIVTASDGTIDRWNDMSGNGNDFITSSLAALSGGGPYWAPDVLAGRHVVAFTASAVTTASPMLKRSPLLTGTATGEIFFVFKSGTGKAGGPTNWQEQGQANHLPFSDDVVYYGFGSTTRYTAFSSATWTRQWAILNIMAKTDRWIARANVTGTYDSPTNTVDWGPETTWETLWSIGESSADSIEGGQAASSGYSGSIAEVLLYDRELTQAERSGTFHYLQSKWGI